MSTDTFTVQAEDLHLNSFYRVGSSNGVTFIEHNSSGSVYNDDDNDDDDAVGVATYDFAGEDGVYDITINLFDENDGESTIDVVLNGVVIDTIELDQTGGGGFIDGSERAVTLSGIALSEGDDLQLRAVRDGNEFARVDNLVFTKTADQDSGSPVATDATVVEFTFESANDDDDDSDATGGPNGKDSTETSLHDTTITTKNGAKIKDGYLKLDGKNDYAVFDDEGFYELEAGRVTVDFSMDKTDSTRTLVSRDANGQAEPGHFTMYVDNGQVVARLQSDQVSYEVRSASNLLKKNTDYKVEFEFGPDGMKLLVDGQVVDTNSYTGGIEGNSEPWVIGANQWNSSQGTSNNTRWYFDGEIYNFKVEAADETYEAVDDTYTTGEDDALTGNLFDNDENVDGQTIAELSAGEVGEPITLDNDMGTLTINADGSFDLLPGAGAGALKDGETVDVAVQYKVQTGTTTVDQGVQKTLDFEGIGEGTLINKIDDVTVEAFRRNEGQNTNSAMIFDSEDPTGGDDDLGTDNQGDILIISEDNNSSNPDDNFNGGLVRFTFDEPVTVEELKLIDNDEGTWIGWYDENWNLIDDVWVSGAGNNSLETIQINGDNVKYLQVNHQGAGIDDVVYSTTQEVETPVFETANATITIVGETDPSIAVADTDRTDEDTPESGNVLDNDIAGDFDLAVTAVAGGTVGEVFEVTSENGRKATFILNADGTYTLTPTDGYDDLGVGETDTFTIGYSIGDTPEDILIRNGDFEEFGTVSWTNQNNGRWTYTDTLAEWDSSTTGIELQQGTVSGSSPIASDNTIVELDAADNITISQTITAGTAGQFKLAFDFIPRSYQGDVAGTSQMEVLVDGVVVGTYSENAAGTYAEELTLDLSAGDHVISFRGAGTSDKHGARVDNVVMERLTGGVDDGSGSSANLTITVDGVSDNEPPAISNRLWETTEELAVNGDILLGVTDPEGDDVTLLSVFDKTNDTAITIGEPYTATTSMGYTGTVLVTAEGLITFTPSADMQALSSDQVDSFEIFFKVIDSAGNVVQKTGRVEIAGVNDDISVGPALSLTTDEDTARILDLTTGTTDPDAGDTLSVQGLTLISGDARVQDAVSRSDTDLTIDGPNTASVQALNEGESITAVFEYDITDGAGSTVTQTATITIEGKNDAPTVAAPLTTSSFDNDVTYSFDMLSGASDIDTGDVLSVTNVQVQSGGTADASTNTGVAGVTFDGSTMTVNPSAYDALNTGDTEVIVITYDVTDSDGATTEQTVTITVQGINDDPVAVDDNYIIGQATAEDANILTGNVITDVAGADQLVDSDSVVVTSFAGEVPGSVVELTLPDPNGGTYTANVTMDAAGNFTFTQTNTTGIALGETEEFTFEYEILDSDGGTDTATVTIAVEGANENPVGVDDTQFVTNEENQLTGNILDNDTDGDFTDLLSVDGVPLNGLQTFTYQLSDPLLGTDPVEVDIRIDSSGNFLFVPGEEFQVLDLGESVEFSFGYTVSDGNGGTATATAEITVEGLDEPVVIEPEQDVINLLFVIDNSASMHETYNDPDGFLFSLLGLDLIDGGGNMDGVDNKIDLALLFATGLVQAVNGNRDTAQPTFINDGDPNEYLHSDGVQRAIDTDGLTPEQRGGTVINAGYFEMTGEGFATDQMPSRMDSDGNDWWNVYESEDTSINGDVEKIFKTPDGTGSDYVSALQQVYDYLDSSPAARQTKVYVISDSESTVSGDHAAIARDIEEDFTATVEAIGISDAAFLAGLSGQPEVAAALANNILVDLEATDTDEPGDFMDIVGGYFETVDLSNSEDAELDFENDVTTGTIFGEDGFLLPEFEYLLGL
ncbi:MAG: Ig-like domain-containing protein [Pseudomonadota bacterium]